jgi:steroid delta-isomerase-like uncharacterized protein
MPVMNASRLLEQWIKAFNQGDALGAQKLFAANAVLEEIGTGRTMKKEEIPAAVFLGWRAAFPDASGKVIRIIVSRNVAAGESVWTGTHKGELMGKTATNQKVMVHAVAIITAEDGLITHLRHYVDIAGMMKQLEAAPKPA